jgi:hypothetical protein
MLPEEFMASIIETTLSAGASCADTENDAGKQEAIANM